MRELISKPREDGKRRVQLWIPDDVYQAFNIALIDEYGHVDFRMSEVSTGLWNTFARDQGRSIDPNFQIKKNLLIRLGKAIEELLTWHEIDEKSLFELFERTTNRVDKRTHYHYRKFFRRIGILEKPKTWGLKGKILYVVNVEKVKQIIEEMKIEQQSKDHQKKKINNGEGINENRKRD